jgi:mono/diheme cytochrome c family protein
LLLSPGAEAKSRWLSDFADTYPAAAGSQLNSCLICHTSPSPSGGNKGRNAYGEDWAERGDKEFAPIEGVDSDGDGWTNIEEIQALSFPGDQNSTPDTVTTTTTVPGTPPDGQSLYGSRCAACHGQNGGNLSGTTLTRTTFVNITLNGQGSMPAQSGLTSAEVGAIWDYVTGAVPTTTTTTRPGATTTSTSPAGGPTVWEENCASCHGANGGNVVPTSLNKTQLVSVVNNGKGSMPAFAWLGSAQVNNVADYMLSLSVPPTTVPGATTTTAPRSGAAVYAASCALCHGADGGNLRGNSLSLSAISSVVANGQGTMSGFSGRLSQAERSNVSQYVLSIGTSGGVTTTTAAPGSSPSGSNLYMQSCSGCHGLHGEGGPGGALAGTTLSRSSTISVISGGAGGMPAYGSQLSSVEIAAIADHVLAMASSTGTTGTTAAGATVVPPELAEGHSLFARFCAACHGVDGEGGLGGPIAGIELSAVELDQIVRNGVGTMPGFADQMSDSEIEALVAFSAALAAGQEFSDADTTTIPPGATQNPGGASGSQALGSSELAPSSSNSPWPVIVVSLLAGLIAAGAAVLWARLGRDLIS